MSIGILKITRNLGFYAQMNSFPVISNLKKANFVKRHGIDVFSIFVLCLISVFFGVPNLYALFQGPMAKWYRTIKYQSANKASFKKLFNSLQFLQYEAVFGVKGRSPFNY